MHRIFVPAVLTLLLASACGPLVELEDENTALRSRVDSLEIILAECRGQGDLLHERLTAIESENLQLDDRNRELSARVVEMQYADPSAAASSPGATVAPDRTAQKAVAPADTKVPVRRDTQAQKTAANSTAQRTPPAVNTTADALTISPYDGRTAAGFDFLRQYQAALNAYNGKQYAESMRLFMNLITGSAGNDMTDNCVYWMGEAAVQLGQQARAKSLFTTVIGYGGADKVDDALVSRASVYAEEGNTAEARKDLNRLLKEYPGSEHIGIARQMLRNLP